MIDKVTTLDGAYTTVYTKLKMKSGETGTRGEALVISAGELTKCVATGKPDAIYVGKVEGQFGKDDAYIPVRDDDIFVIDITGDASTVVIGTSTYCLTSDGLNLDAATSTGGRIKVLDVDVAKKKARIQFV